MRCRLIDPRYIPRGWIGTLRSAMIQSQLPSGSLRALAETLWHGVVQLVYPATCWVCGGHVASMGPLVCQACRSAITEDPHSTCPRCSSTVGPFINLDKGCPACRDESFAFERALRMGPYEGPLRDVVLRMKRFGGEDLWACAIAPRLQAEAIDVVIPVPLHWWRRWQRGFNQSEVLAHPIARVLGIPCWPTGLRCARRIAEQKALSPTARRANVHDAFRCSKPTALSGKTVLLVDDVMTTGATAHETARALRVGRPARILVAVLAHGR